MPGGVVIYIFCRNISSPVKNYDSPATAVALRPDPLPLQMDDSSQEKPVSAFRSILPQILAVNVKNVLLFGYGMTLGFPTILIPAIMGGEGRESTMDNKLHLSKEEISWLSTYQKQFCLLGLHMQIPAPVGDLKNNINCRFNKFNLRSVGMHILWILGTALGSTQGHAICQHTHAGGLALLPFLNRGDPPIRRPVSCRT